ncbi:hydrolase 1, exosortase A system-associated [Duganella sp. P38]|uniref:hydrolase 1, exosortase A system-associated n=1 Tax=Duganella sp. P38 TaxID=3423949 RepID=UPI003D7A24CA
MHFEEQAQTIVCGDQQLIGVLARPTQPATRGVLIIVGGPQYRAGSHRQFTLLARHLAGRGVPVLRFDYRGMGDSDGDSRSFEDVNQDVRAAIDHFFASVSQLREVALWGLCDGASAALFYAAQDARVRGLALLNPWARTEAGAAQATLKHYYRRRLLQPELWRKLLAGRFDAAAAWRSLRVLLAASRQAMPAQDQSLPARLYRGWQAFNGPVLLMLSGADLTAREFAALADSTPEWRALLARDVTTRRELAGADHTCSRAVWRDQIADWTSDWVRAW